MKRKGNDLWRNLEKQIGMKRVGNLFGPNKNFGRVPTDIPVQRMSGKYHLNPKSSSFKFSPLLVRDVREAINKVKTSKGYGTDGNSSYFLKLALPFIEPS